MKKLLLALVVLIVAHIVTPVAPANEGFTLQPNVQVRRLTPIPGWQEMSADRALNAVRDEVSTFLANRTTPFVDVLQLAAYLGESFPGTQVTQESDEYVYVYNDDGSWIRICNPIEFVSVVVDTLHNPVIIEVTWALVDEV